MTTLKEKSFTRQHHGCPRGMGVHYIGQVRKEVLCITVIITKITTNTSAIFITKIILNVIVGLYGVGQDLVRKEVLRGGKSGSDLGRHPCANHTTGAIQHNKVQWIKRNKQSLLIYTDIGRHPFAKQRSKTNLFLGKTVQ